MITRYLSLDTLCLPVALNTKKDYSDLYEGGKKHSVVVLDNGASSTGDHITVMIPIKNSRGFIEGILCVQGQMTELDAEKNFFLKRTVAAALIVLVMAFPFGLRYLKSKLLNPLSLLTQGVKEISSATSIRSLIFAQELNFKR